jgi:mannose-6-phosphate isomerase
MSLFFSSQVMKDRVFEAVANHLQSLHLRTIAIDDHRPWGGFFVVEEKDAEKFIDAFFPGLEGKEISRSSKLSPKILIVAPGKRLSWQYHHRRAEIWKLVGGRAGVATSDSDEERGTTYLNQGDIIRLRQGERHRLIGLEEWGIIAEIWQHTEAENPSDENDIIRLQDDFGR